MDRITAEEAARLLGYHVKHIYRLLREGVLTGQKFNGVWEIDRDVVLNLKRRQSESGRLYWHEDE